jgi:monovalent cation/hydrogen antiporter
MPRIDIVIALLAVSIPLVALARTMKVGYPVLLVLGGLVLCFVPGLPQVEIHPELVFMVFLPPLLYWQAVTAPTGAMHANLDSIGSLAIGLVLATAFAVALVAKAIVPAMAWPAAIALGAIVAPTDDVAFWSVAERLRLPRRVAALIGGEALLNDASSLILYGVAVTAVVSGTFSPGSTGLRLLWIVPSSIAIGMLAGYLVSLAWSRLRDPQLQTMISVIAPYLAYLPAAQIGLSGVLAVVTAGVWVNRTSPRLATPAARQRTAGFWETTILLMNAIMFVLVGFHLHDTLPTLGRYPITVIVGAIVAVNAAVIALRILWIFAGGFIADRLRRVARGDGERGWKYRAIASWAGLRGGVSLATALALPRTAAGGAPFAHRDLIILVSFSVILVTLVGQGLSLPWLVSRIGSNDDVAEEDEQRQAIAAMRSAALRRVDELERDGRIVPDDALRLRRYVNRRKPSDDGGPNHEAVRELVRVERDTLIEARERGMIDNTVLRRMQASLDMEELQLEHHVPSPEGERRA